VVQSVATKHRNAWYVCDMCAENLFLLLLGLINLLNA